MTERVFDVTPIPDQITYGLHTSPEGGTSIAKVTPEGVIWLLLVNVPTDHCLLVRDKLISEHFVANTVGHSFDLKASTERGYPCETSMTEQVGIYVSPEDFDRLSKAGFSLRILVFGIIAAPAPTE